MQCSRLSLFPVSFLDFPLKLCTTFYKCRYDRHCFRFTKTATIAEKFVHFFRRQYSIKLICIILVFRDNCVCFFFCIIFHVLKSPFYSLNYDQITSSHDQNYKFVRLLPRSVPLLGALYAFTSPLGLVDRVLSYGGRKFNFQGVGRLSVCPLVPVAFGFQWVLF